MTQRANRNRASTLVMAAGLLWASGSASVFGQEQENDPDRTGETSAEQSGETRTDPAGEIDSEAAAAAASLVEPTAANAVTPDINLIGLTVINNATGEKLGIISYVDMNMDRQPMVKIRLRGNTEMAARDILMRVDQLTYNEQGDIVAFVTEDRTDLIEDGELIGSESLPTEGVEDTEGDDSSAAPVQDGVGDGR